MRWVVAVLMAGCAHEGPVEAEACGADLVADLVGQPFVTLAGVDLPGTLRVVYPGQVVLDEVQAGRLNAGVDGTGRILRVYCG